LWRPDLEIAFDTRARIEAHVYPRFRPRGLNPHGVSVNREGSLVLSVNLVGLVLRIGSDVTMDDQLYRPLILRMDFHAPVLVVDLNTFCLAGFLHLLIVEVILLAEEGRKVSIHVDVVAESIPVHAS